MQWVRRCDLRLWLLTLLAGLAACVTPDFSTADSEFPKSGFAFYSGSQDRAGDLYLGLTELEHPESGVRVVLIPMYHVAGAAYYATVQEELDRSDLVLIEGVGDDPSLAPSQLLLEVMFGNLRRIASFTELTRQHEALRLGRNWKPADLPLADWRAGMPWWSPAVQTLCLPLIVVAAESAALVSWFEQLVLAPFGSPTAVEAAWRHFVVSDANQPDDDGLDFLLPGIISERNARVLQVFEESLAQESVRRIAIPWGAAHMPGILRGLEQLGYTTRDHRWVRAISVASLLAGKEDAANESTDFLIPYLLHWRSHAAAWNLTLALGSLRIEAPPEGYQVELLWSLLAFLRGSDVAETSAFQLLPSLLGRPILFRWSTRGAASELRFLLFFEIGSLDD